MRRYGTKSWECFSYSNNPCSRIFFFVLKPNPMTTNNNTKNSKANGILRNAIAIPIKPIDNIAPKENNTKTHFMLPKTITPKKIMKNNITLVPLVL